MPAKVPPAENPAGVVTVPPETKSDSAIIVNYNIMSVDGQNAASIQEFPAHRESALCPNIQALGSNFYLDIRGNILADALSSLCCRPKKN
jgi:hypothetical protein